MANKVTDRPQSSTAKSSADDVASQQGKAGETPQREHERERVQPKPASPQKNDQQKNQQQDDDSCGCGTAGKPKMKGDANAKDAKNKNHPPQRHDESSDIDDSEQPR